MKKNLSFIAALLAVVTLAGCSSPGVNGPTALPDSEPGSPPVTSGSTTVTSGSTPATSGSTPATSGSTTVTSGASIEKYEGTDIGGVGFSGFGEEGDYEFAVAEDCAEGGITDGTMIAAGSATGEKGIGTDIGVEPIGEPMIPSDDEPMIEPQAGLLTGGEWNDNDHWTDWNELYKTHEDWMAYKTFWKQDKTERLVVTVTANGEPLEGALVSAPGDYAGDVTSAVTDNKGKAYVFHKSTDNPITLTVTYGDATAEVVADGMSELSCELQTTPKTEKKLDLMIMCDTTGSMGDELEYLKTELADIVTKIKTDNSNIPTRISVNFYRDSEDEYEVRQFPFSDNLDEVVKSLSEQFADGGGDFPEAVHTALDSAVNQHDWDEDSVKIMFLVLDAPPHEDAQIIDSVNKYVEKAAEMGIRIVPIASSGIDKSTEYLLRTMAFTTGGTYTFLTDDSGIGGEHIEPTIGAYNVEKLNDMMVRIVNSYLA